MQRFARPLLVLSLMFLLSGRSDADEILDQKIAEQQKLADEAQARKAAAEPAITTARTAAKEKSAAVAALKLEQNKAEAGIKDSESKLPKLQEALKKATEERTKAEAELAVATKAAQEAKGKETEQAEADKAKAAAEKLVAGTKLLEDALKAAQPVEVMLAAGKKSSPNNRPNSKLPSKQWPRSNQNLTLRRRLSQHSAKKPFRARSNLKRV